MVGLFLSGRRRLGVCIVHVAEKVEPGGVPQCMHKKICIQKKHNLFGNWEEGVCYTFMNVQGRGGK